MATQYLQKFSRAGDIRDMPSAAGIGVLGSQALLNVGGNLIPLGGLEPNGAVYYVDANLGSDSYDGRSWGTAFLTMAAAFAVLDSGDTIVFRGKIREQLTAPAQIFDVTIIGAGNRPRHADDTPDGGQEAANTWTTPASPTAATPLLKLQQQGWRVVNVLFAGPSDAACVQLHRTADSGDDEKDASHAEFINCRFASGQDGISDTGGCFNVVVRNCKFGAVTAFCILGVGNIGVGQLEWTIVDNEFLEFTNGIKIAGFRCRVQNNLFTDGGTPNTTVVCNMANGGGAGNFIIYNFFQTATANFNTPDVVGSATDVWWNTSIDATAAGVGTNREVGQPA
jgi:hypothetical protein